ncbi:MAG: ABC transporter substrate-binding protein [Kiritimatiellae bacterium]|nr:ABC transporter substrate-binding protein [Kiritimatiellia bacterium]
MSRTFFAKTAAAALFFAAAAAAHADTRFPAPDWTDKPSRWANPDAPKGGRVVLAAGAVPKSLNYYLENSTFAAQACSMLFESLLTRDPDSGEFAPALARSWTVSDDGLAFTFDIDPAARWSDGAPVTAEDVRWTFAAIVSPSNATGAAKVSLSQFDEPEVLSERTVRFKARETHWRNLGAAGGMFVLPAHVFRDRDFNEVNFDFPAVSGPYRIGEFRENRSLSFVRRPDWWAAGRPSNRGLWNFDEILWRFFVSRENAWEAFRKGLVDAFAVYTASTWALDARGERFDKNWIVKRAVRNRKPVGFQGFALNMRRPDLSDVRVRKALALLLDREGFNRSLMFGQYFMHRSYWEDLYDESAPCTNEFFRYDPPRARQLLAEAGWRRDQTDGTLRDASGRQFVLRFLSNSPASDKFLARWKAALRNEAGIALEVERKDWAAWMRDMDAHDFDCTWCAWSSGLEKDPESMWSGAQADEHGGNNVTGFSDPEVDALIEAQKTEFSLEARNAVDREIDARLAAAVPYVLLWNSDATRLAWWNKFGMPPAVLSRFGGEEDVVSLWWADPEAEAALADAMAEGAPLPPPPLAD